MAEVKKDWIRILDEMQRDALQRQDFGLAAVLEADRARTNLDLRDQELRERMRRTLHEIALEIVEECGLGRLAELGAPGFDEPSGPGCSPG